MKDRAPDNRPLERTEPREDREPRVHRRRLFKGWVIISMIGALAIVAFAFAALADPEWAVYAGVAAEITAVLLFFCGGIGLLLYLRKVKRNEEASNERKR